MEMHQQTNRSVSSKVDLTPMVDLGFLLITFFLLATSFSKPKVMEIYKPIMDNDPIPYPQSKTATLILGTSNKIYTYYLPDKLDASFEFTFDSTDYSYTGLRKYIQNRQSEVQSRFGDKEMLFVIIKPLPEASFKNIVDVLDEMLINGVNRYAIVEANSPVDSMVLRVVGELER